MNDLPAVAAESKNTTTVTILHVIVAKNGLNVLGLPRDSPLLAVTDERRESGGKTGCFSDLSNAIFPRSPSLLPSLYYCSQCRAGEESELEVGAWKRGKEGRGVRGGDLI